MSSFKEVLYEPVEDENDTLAQSLETKQAIRTWRYRFFALLGVLAVVASSLGGLCFRLSNTTSCPELMDGVKQPFSPVADRVRYVNKYLTQDPDTHKFMGKPRPEVDQAWHDLLEGTLIRVTGEELLAAGNATSVAHKDGGYVAGLGLSHNLHCLKRLKQYFNKDYYYGHEEQDWEELEMHAEHCLEGLRQAMMCQADLSLYTLEWTPHSRTKPTVRVPQAHACVDFPSLHDWMKRRAANSDDMVPAPSKLYEGQGS